MLGSKSTYFHQSQEVLATNLNAVFAYLKSKGYTSVEIRYYLEAFTYFSENPNDFDGATFVKDICDIDGLDLDAMLHDYMCLALNASASYETKSIADKIYYRQMLRKNKPKNQATFYFVLLKMVGTLHVIYSVSKRGFISRKNEKRIYRMNKFFEQKNTY